MMPLTTVSLGVVGVSVPALSLLLRYYAPELMATRDPKSNHHNV